MLRFAWVGLVSLAASACISAPPRRPPRLDPSSPSVGESAPPPATPTTPTTTEPTTEPAAAGVYACPMHPDVRQPGPGRCPKCGMELVPTPRADGGT